MVHLALLYYYVWNSHTVVVHTAQYDNSYLLVSAFRSQQESATSKDVLHFNFLSSLSSCSLSLQGPLVVKSACLQSLITAQAHWQTAICWWGGLSVKIIFSFPLILKSFLTAREGEPRQETCTDWVTLNKNSNTYWTSLTRFILL